LIPKEVSNRNTHRVHTAGLNRSAKCRTTIRVITSEGGR